MQTCIAAFSVNVHRLYAGFKISATLALLLKPRSQAETLSKVALSHIIVTASPPQAVVPHTRLWSLMCPEAKPISCSRVALTMGRSCSVLSR